MIVVLRLGHRIRRDQRMTTHVALVSRAFKASEVILTGEYDPSIIEVINNVNASWGSSIAIRYSEDFEKEIINYKSRGFTIVHLTMKGDPLSKHLPHLKKTKDIMLIVGSQKVPSIIYKLADYNIAVTKEPHSEVGALAITLNQLTDAKYI